MEGLLIAEQLRALAPLLPSGRRTWRFPDDRTAVLPLVGDLSLWLTSRPPQPRFELRTGAPAAASPKTPFQEQLAARAVGDLVAASQPALDRVVRLLFAPGEGFVPEPGTALVAELTGRNSNLLLLDERGTILGVERVILAQRNRYRELRPGIAYVPPPPYQKLNPLEADATALATALRGCSIKEVRDVVDGIGPQLLAALQARLSSGFPRSESGEGAEETAGPLEGVRLAGVVAAIQELALEPSAALVAQGKQTGVAELGLERRLEQLRGEVEAALGRRLKLATRRVTDAEEAIAAADDAVRLRAEADLLLANASRYAPEGANASLHQYDGTQTILEIDPRLDAAGNAKARYDRAKRREARAARAHEQLPQLSAQLAAVEEALRSVEAADEGDLKRLARQGQAMEAEGGHGGASGRASGGAVKGLGKRAERHRERERTGVSFVDPRGYEVFVGRSAKENDAITFKLARSRDLWLHVQGYRGAHVVVRSQGRELPFDTVLFAARLAAGFSQARGSDNVAVDYTERKNVWRPKGAPAGAVNFAHHKTVYVAPARDDAGASGGA